MKTYTYTELSDVELRDLCARKETLSDAVIHAVEHIEQRVLEEGDAAIKALTEKFDGAVLDQFLVTDEELDQADVDLDFADALSRARDNIHKFHAAQLPSVQSEKIETSPGVFCWRKFHAIDSVGLYIPGGSAPLFSTILMLAIPAMIAGCKRVVLCTPPASDGNLCPEVLFAAKLLGVHEVYKVGGAQAIFAMAHGTDQIKKVDKIFGPGNAYVTAAKMKVSTHTAIDMPAGPSEVLVIADENSDASFVASDLLSQAEHGPDSQAVLVCHDQAKIDEILAETQTQLDDLPRQEIASKAIENSFAVLTGSLEQSFDFSNIYAPEHLILSFDDYEEWLDLITEAGSVFCGPLASESFGDYASGTNHTLPTSGFARTYSGVNTASFGKWVTYQDVTSQGLHDLGEVVELMAEREGLFAHKNAVTIRKNRLNICK